LALFKIVFMLALVGPPPPPPPPPGKEVFPCYLML
jgi:hypothetical protein